MLGIIILTAVGAALAGGVYLGRERLGAQGLGLAALRTLAFGALFVALFNPGGLRRIAGGATTVLLDASLSMDASGGRWQAALDTARALADGGTIYRFGSTVAPFDTLAPIDGDSRLKDALEATAGRTGAVYVVSDGEIQDGATLPPSLAHGVEVVVLARDTVPNAALLDVAMDRRVQDEDSIGVTIVVGTWGALDTAGARIDIVSGTTRLLSRALSLPPSPGTARRTFVIPPGLLPAGDHVIAVRVSLATDAEPRDDERQRIVTVSTQPAVVVIVDPADTEGAWLVNEIGAVASTSVQGFARLQQSLWVEMRTLRPVPESTVRAAARAARLLVIRGRDQLQLGATHRATWFWPAATDPTTEFFDGDWYVTPELPASPLAGRLARAAWDSVPPLVGIVPLVARGGEWIGLTGRLARRGVDRPLLIGRDSSGYRRLTTAGLGLWRWVLRGGAARETYRALVAGGTDWLLQTGRVRSLASLSAVDVVQRGVPVAFRWSGDDMPDSAVVSLVSDDSTRMRTLRFDPGGVALLSLEPGTYRWSVVSAGGARGVSVVEEFSDEYHVRPVTMGGSAGDAGYDLIMRRAREVWWLFAVAMVALMSEWGWRQRRGLP